MKSDPQILSRAHVCVLQLVGKEAYACVAVLREGTSPTC